jgi:hypothetical protein
LQTEGDQANHDFEDEIKPQDGLLRYWVFLNGEQFRLFAAIAAAFFTILWCFLYILGNLSGAIRTAVLVLAAVSFGIWRLLDRQIREFETRGWRKSKGSVRKEKVEIRVAVVLWLFILISICVTMLW